MRPLLLSSLLMLAASTTFAQNLEWVLNGHYPEGYPFPEFNSVNSYGVSIDIDSDGYIYSTGIYNRDLFIGSPEQPILTNESNSMYIIKSDGSGNILWAKSIQSTNIPASNGMIIPTKLSLDNQGNPVVIGKFIGMVDFDPSENLSELHASGGGGMDSFILKVSSDGDFLWVNQVNDLFGENINDSGLLVDSEGNINILGTIQHDLFLNESFVYQVPDENIGYTHVYMIKFDSNGALQSFTPKLTAPSCHVSLRSFALGTNEELIVGLDIYVGNATINEEAYPHMASLPQAKTTLRQCVFDGTGNLLENIDILSNDGFSTNFVTNKLTVDSDGNFVVIGKLTNTVDFDISESTYSLGSLGDEQAIVIAKYSVSGDFLWARKIDSEAVHTLSIALDTSDNIFVLGQMQGTTDFGSNGVFNHTYNGNGYEVFFLKLNPDGHLDWVNFIGNQSQWTGSITCDNTNSVYYTGSYDQSVNFWTFGYNFMIESNNIPNSNNAIICKFNQGECSQLFGYIVSSTSLDCAESVGYAEAAASGGIQPYEFLWNTNPPSNQNYINVDSTGIYTVSVADAEGCQKSVGVYIYGPDVLDYYDFRTDIFVLSPNNFVPGQLSTVRVVASNVGCLPENALLKISLDSQVNYVESSISPSSIVFDTLFFDLGILQFGNAPSIVDIVIVTDTTAAMEDEVCFVTQISPLTNDYNLSNNSKSICRNVQTSYDPNQKSVYPVGECEQHYVEHDQKLTYTVQFQNTGTFAAINIAVMDTLSSLLDINTLRVIHSSHDMITEVYDDHILKFKFPNIYLADSATNEEESHGYIIFEIEPKTTIASGSMIENNVAIYFDYNAPVITNKVFNTFVHTIPECVVSLDEIVSKDGGLLLYPNPVGDMMTLVLKDKSIKGTTIRISDITGKVIEHKNHNVDGNIVLDTSALESGVYVLTLMNGQEIQSVRFVKQ